MLWLLIFSETFPVRAINCNMRLRKLSLIASANVELLSTNFPNGSSSNVATDEEGKYWFTGNLSLLGGRSFRGASSLILQIKLSNWTMQNQISSHCQNFIQQFSYFCVLSAEKGMRGEHIFEYRYQRLQKGFVSEWNQFLFIQCHSKLDFSAAWRCWKWKRTSDESTGPSRSGAEGISIFSHMNIFWKKRSEERKKGINHNEGFTAQSRVDERQPIHMNRSVISTARLLNLQLLGGVMM